MFWKLGFVQQAREALDALQIVLGALTAGAGLSKRVFPLCMGCGVCSPDPCPFSCWHDGANSHCQGS